MQKNMVFNETGGCQKLKAWKQYKMIVHTEFSEIQQENKYAIFKI